MAEQQSQESVKSFEHQWTQFQTWDSEADYYRRLFTDQGVLHDYYDGKVVADVGSGNGRASWFLAKLTKAKKIISIELAIKNIEKQKSYIKDPRVEFIQEDAGLVKFKADIICCFGFIQHTRNPQAVLKNLVANLNDGGELLVSFYGKTLATMGLEPLRFLLKRLPKKILWVLTPLLAPIFMARKAGRSGGFKNARVTAYDWFGSHHYQYYFSESEARTHLINCGLHPNNILKIRKGAYRARAGEFPLSLDETLKAF